MGQFKEESSREGSEHLSGRKQGSGVGGGGVPEEEKEVRIIRNHPPRHPGRQRPFMR